MLNFVAFLVNDLATGFLPKSGTIMTEVLVLPGLCIQTG